MGVGSADPDPPLELDASTYAEVARLSEAGERLMEEARFRKAISSYQRALALLPEPARDWEAATWLHAAIGDAYFFLGDFEECRECFNESMHCPGGIGNPFLHMRLGQAELELDNQVRARDELARAFMGGGDEIFEDEDPKYLECIKGVLRKPRGEGE